MSAKSTEAAKSERADTNGSVGSSVAVMDAPSPQWPTTLTDEQIAALPEKNIALIGYTTSRSECPLGDPGWEVYGMNNLHTLIDADKCSRWYDLHTPQQIMERTDDEGGPAHVAWLRSWTKYPIFIMDPLEGVAEIDGNPVPSLAERTGWPMARAFPTRAINERFGTYFTNTVSWQIAHILAEAIEADGSTPGGDYNLSRIALFGIDMAVGSEYAEQRPSVEYFLGLARGMGVDIVLPGSSDLLKCAAQYGKDADASGYALKLQVRISELTQRKNELESQVAQLQHAHAATCGAIDSLRYASAVWMPPSAARTNRDGVRLPGGSVSEVGDAMMQADYEARQKG